MNDSNTLKATAPFPTNLPSLVDTFTFEPLSITDDSSSSDNHPVQEQTSHLHIVFVVDTTGSMNVFLQALKESLHQINALLRVLFPESSAISVLTYKDYCQYPRKEVMRCKIQGSYAELSEFCATLSATGGGDLAEASKTAFNQVSRLARNKKNDTMIVLHYTDAPPHVRLTNPSGSNRLREMKALEGKRPGFDWCHISKRFRKISHRVRLFTLVPDYSHANGCGSAFWALLGELIALRDVSASGITRTTMTILLQLLGQDDDKCDATGKAQRVCFRDHEHVMGMLFEDSYSEDTFPYITTEECKEPTVHPTKKNAAHLKWMDHFNFQKLDTIRRQDLAGLKVWFQKSENRNLTFDILHELTQPNRVMALTTNPIFGRLWRLVCNTRDDDRLSILVSRMGGCASSAQLSLEEELN